ncbi:MAG: hypothetical protein J0M37_13585 [Ignavibacteria bacterium]|nr:hypothetical protein [Ignavibacteria bacterium]
MKFFNFKFILTATLTYIPYTALWFFWHNNLFHKLYYSVNSFYSINEQNIWLMNFANALLVYGFVYFYRRFVKPDTLSFKAALWGVYYNLSVTGFYTFMLMGAFKEWNASILIHDLIWAVLSGTISGLLAFHLNKYFGGNLKQIT